METKRKLYLYPRKCDFCGKGMEKGMFVEGETYCDEKCIMDFYQDKKVFTIGDKICVYKDFLQILNEDTEDELFYDEVYEWYYYSEWSMSDNDNEYGYDIFGNKHEATLDKAVYDWK